MRVNPIAPEGCGRSEHEGSCFSCIVRHTRRSLRQLLPLRYNTHYFTGGSAGVADGEKPNPEWINVEQWRMWFGRVFAHDKKRYEVAPGTWAKVMAS